MTSQTAQDIWFLVLGSILSFSLIVGWYILAAIVAVLFVGLLALMSALDRRAHLDRRYGKR